MLVIRSYRAVFRIERRIHRIDRWQLPLPGGLPVRALVYAPIVYALLALAARLPVLGAALGALPDPVRYALLPLGLVWAALNVELDGRPVHRVAWSLARWAVERRWLAGLRPCPPPLGRVALTGTLTVRPDHRGSVYRPGTVRGPARALLRRPAALARARARVTLTPAPGGPQRRGQVLDVPAGAELVIR